MQRAQAPAPVNGRIHVSGERMNAAVLVEPRRWEIERVPVPAPGPGQVQVKVEGCGICGSNLPPWSGVPGLPYPRPPGDAGHEAWGVVVARGPGVSHPREGQRVVPLCQRAFAEYDVTEADALVVLPDAGVPREIPGEPLACAVNVMRRAAVAQGDVVVVLGVGFLGALLLQLLQPCDAARVIAVSRRDSARATANRIGFTEVRSYADVESYVGDATDGRGADVVIEATGAAAPLDLAGRLCRERGRLVVAGYHQDGPRQIDLRLWNWKGLDVINAHERDPRVYRRGLEVGVEALAEGAIDLKPLLTHRLPLTSIQQAFELARRRPEGFMKAAIVAEPPA